MGMLLQLAGGFLKGGIQGLATMVAPKTQQQSGSLVGGGSTTSYTSGPATTMSSSGTQPGTPWYKAPWVIPAAVGTGVVVVIAVLYKIFERR